MSNHVGEKSFYRGFLLDSARCLEKRSYYRNAIDFAADRGMSAMLWHFTDDQGCSLQFECVPEIASPNAYSKTQMRELIAYARQRGIELIPELASLGHCRYLTCLPAYQHLNETEAHFTGMCPVSPETRRVVQALIEETIDVFDSANFHVGLDEVNIGEHPLTRVAMQTSTRPQLLADYINFLYGVVTGKGRRLWMWGDGLLKYPEILTGIRSDIVVCNWQYNPQVPSASTQSLLDAGFDVMLFSALISHDQTLFPGQQYALPNIRGLNSHRAKTGRGRVLGHITTIWTPVRFIADSLWVGLDLAAAILRQDSDVIASEQAAQFGCDFYGLNPDQAKHFATVVMLLLEHSPLRKDWLAVAKLQPLSPSMLLKAKAAALAWSQALGALENLSNNINNHAQEFSSFTLLVEMLEHCFSVAVDLTGEVSTEALIAMYERGEQILQRVSQNWDRERFADDPRKFTAPIVSFQDDHLIPLLQSGLAILKKKLEQSQRSDVIAAAKSVNECAQTCAI